MSRVRRILMTADAVGGVWQYATDLARGLAGRGIETLIAVIGPSPTAAQAKLAESIDGLALVDTGLPLDWMALSHRAICAAGDAVAELASEHGVDLVQLNAPALAAESDFPVPVLAVNHSCVTTWWQSVYGGRPEGPYAWRGRMTGRGLAAADRIVTPTAAFAEATRRAYGLKTRPTPVHNGRAPLPLPRRARHDFAFTAGRLWDKGKNAATIDRIASRLTVPFHAAGPLRSPGGDAVRLEHARSLGTLGEEQLGRWLAAGPVFVSAAYYEPFGLAVLEAAAAGCPLVLSDLPSFRELWDGAAVFVEPTNDILFAEAIGEIIGDDVRHAQLGAAARERAARYTLEVMSARMAAIYDELVAGRAKEAEQAVGGRGGRVAA